MTLPVEGVFYHTERHEITVTAGGDDYTVTENDFLSLRIAENGEVSGTKLAFAAEKLSCIKKASSFLSYGDLSSGRLSEKLKMTKRFTPEAIDATVALFQSKGYLDDAALAARFAAQLASGRLWGKIRIKNYLYQKGFSGEDIRAALETIGDFETRANLSMLVEREMQKNKYQTGDRASMAKLWNALYRAGYSGDEIRAALEEFKDLNI